MTEAEKRDIAGDTQLSLEAAARLAFPDGSVSALTLRAEAARGKLAIWRVGKRYLTTLAAIERMIALCPVLPKVRISTSAVGPAVRHAGSSETEGMKSAQAALQASVKELKKGSRPILRRNTDLPLATVIRPEFPSRTSSPSTPRKEHR